MTDDADDARASSRPLLDNAAQRGSRWGHWSRWRRQSQHYLASKEKHYLILALVGLDVAAILTEILVSLVTCEMGTQDEPWVDPVLEATKVGGLVISSLFLAELLATIWAFGWECVLRLLFFFFFFSVAYAPPSLTVKVLLVLVSLLRRLCHSGQLRH